MPKVSIIIAAFNCERYIDKCLDSIISQSFKDFEIIICDDASTDNTYNKLVSWAKKDTRIHILKNEINLFAGATRNRCLEKASSEYIAIQDADDYSDVTRIERQVRFLENSPQYQFVSSGMFRFDDEGIWQTSIPNIIKPMEKDFLSGLPYVHAATMFRKSALQSISGYRIARETERGQDYDLFMRLHAAGYKGYNLQEPFYYYREDKSAFKRRKYKYRIHEAIVRYKGFKALGLLPKYIIYVFRPILVGLIPNTFMRRIKKKNIGK